MACSCKAKQQSTTGATSITFYNSLKNTYKVATVDTTPKEVQQYDFSTDTKPSQYCRNCIQKHLALAIAMIQQGSFVEILTAAGELLLASQHYSSQNKVLALRCYYLGLDYLQHLSQKQKYLQRIKLLLQNNIVSIKLPIWWNNIQQPKLQQPTQEWSYRFACLLQLCGAYCLIFTQMGYLDVNKAFAIGKMSRVANILQQIGYKREAQTLRQLWKKLQQMKPQDSIYKQARTQFQQTLRFLYTQFSKDPKYKKV